MKKLITLFIMVSLFFITPPSFAEIPHYMQFQGKATDGSDVPLNGNHDLTFRIYDIETGGTPIWNETHTSVAVETGIFSVLLGGVTPLDIAFDEPYWISMEIDTTDGTNELPRQLISSVGYAYRAKEATHAEVADTVNNLIIENRTDDPPSPATGQIWLRTDQ